MPQTTCSNNVPRLRGHFGRTYVVTAHLLKTLGAIVASVFNVSCSRGIERRKSSFRIGIQDYADNVAHEVSGRLLESGVVANLKEVSVGDTGVRGDGHYALNLLHAGGDRARRQTLDRRASTADKRALANIS